MFASVNGTCLNYERLGKGPALLFIHGTALDHRMWRTQVEALSQRYDVIAYDVRGFGQSAPPDGPFCHYQDAEALLQHLGVEQCVVVGHSAGGLYALELTLARPDLVTGCGLVCAGIGAGAPFPPDLQALMARLRETAASRGVEAARALWSESILFATAREIPSVRRELDAIFADYSGWYWLHGSPAGNLAPPVHERLESMTVPVLVVDGGRDHAYLHAISNTLASRIPRATLLRLPHVGHMANMEDPAAVTRAIDELAAIALQLLELREKTVDESHRTDAATAAESAAAKAAPYPLEGGCACRYVRYRMTSGPLFVHCCHCRWCQRETGTAFALNAMIESDRVQVLAGEPELVDTPSQSGKGQQIARCPRCHVAVWSHYAGAGPSVKFLRVGTLDAPDHLPPDIHIFTSSKQPWVILPPGTPAMPEYYDLRNHWPPESLARGQVLRAQAKAAAAG